MAQATMALQQVGRKMRRPQHQFQIRQRPWQIQPFMIAPVLPGETLENLLVQSRIVTDPIKNPLIGWWAEMYFFYVKHRDLDGRDDFAAMMLDPATDLSGYNEASATAYYHAGSAINWTKLCLKRIVEEFFKDEGETWDGVTIDSMPVASINQQSWLDSVDNDDTYTADDVDITVGVDDVVTASEIETALRQWEFLRLQGLTNMSYEDYLTTYGVRMPQVELHRPELIRYVRDWKYPTNHVDPSSGSPSSAVVWSIAERADKKRFFTEPGFVVGLSVVRPKVYRQAQTGSAISLLSDAYRWLPAVLLGDTEHSIVKVTAGSGPLPAVTDDYRVDTRDIFLYGDQFINFSLSETDANLIDIPTAALQKRYADSDDANELFVDTSTPLNKVRMDGVVHLQILGVQTDLTPRVNRG